MSTNTLPANFSVSSSTNTTFTHSFTPVEQTYFQNALNDKERAILLNFLQSVKEYLEKMDERDRVLEFLNGSGFFDEQTSEDCESGNVSLNKESPTMPGTIDPNFNLDVFTLCRFLRANKYNASGALTQLSHYIQYRLTENPYHITPKDFQSRLREKAVGWWQGRDKEGCIFFVLRPQFHDPKTRIMRDALLHSFYMAENVIAKMDNQNMEGNDRYCVVYDGRYLTWNMMDFPIIKEFSKLNEFYPERLKAIYILKPGWIFSSILFAAKKLMNPQTASKIVTISDFAQLFDHIGREQIPEEYEGTSTYEYNHEHLWLPHTLAAFDLSDEERQRMIEQRKALLLKSENTSAPATKED